MPHDFLELAGKTIVVCGVANKKSVAWHAGQVLQAAGATVVYTVRTPQRREQAAAMLPGAEIHVCDVERQAEIDRLADEVAERHPVVHGLLHSIAFADYRDGGAAFHRTSREAFLRSVDISCFSLIALSRAFERRFATDASVVSISISTTRMAAENYGFMAPVKAALDSSLVFLAKSFSRFSRVRFNAVGAGLLKTASSAGIPGYVDAYLYAEQATLRHRALDTREVADVAAFLLSPRSSGINAQTLTVDAGMEVNYFDAEIVRRATGGELPP